MTTPSSNQWSQCKYSQEVVKVSLSLGEKIPFQFYYQVYKRIWQPLKGDIKGGFTKKIAQNLHSVLFFLISALCLLPLYPILCLPFCAFCRLLAPSVSIHPLPLLPVPCPVYLHFASVYICHLSLHLNIDRFVEKRVCLELCVANSILCGLKIWRTVFGESPLSEIRVYVHRTEVENLFENIK